MKAIGSNAVAAAVSKDGTWLRCGSCGAPVAQLLRCLLPRGQRAGGRRGGEVNAIRFRHGYAEEVPSVWVPLPETEAAFRFYRHLVSVDSAIPEKVKEAAKKGLEGGRSTWMTGPGLSPWRLPVRVRCLRCRADNVVERDLVAPQRATL